MNFRRLLYGLSAFAIYAAATADGYAQATIDGFGVGKKADYLQTSSATPNSQVILGDPVGPYHFSADLSGTNLNLWNPAPKVTTPTAVQYSLTGDSADVGMVGNYASKSTLDAAFPNGSYSFKAGAYTLPISLGAGDAYPADIPRITNGTWDTQGRLEINATTGATINFSSHSAYTSGAGGMVTFELYALSGNSLGAKLGGAESTYLTGFYADGPLTSYLIMPGTLLPNQTYYAELSFARFPNINTTFADTLGAVGVATFVNTTGFIISTTPPLVLPSFTTQPLSKTVTTADSVTFSVVAVGNPAPSLQWRKNGVNIDGATSASLTLNLIELSDAGPYTVVATNSAGSSVSNVATLTVNEGLVAPVITGFSSPTRNVLVPGQALNLGVKTIVTGTPSYQWFHNGRQINGATTKNLLLGSAALTDAGWYVVTISNAYGTTRSAPVFVIVAPATTRVRTWGAGYYGADYTPPSGLSDAVSISAGADYFLAVHRDGTVIGWGANDSRKNEGRLDLPAGLSGVVAVSTGANHALALKADGTVVVWGQAVLDYNRVPDGLSNVVAISAGYNHSLALKSDGTVVAWGDNYYGQSTVPANLDRVVAVSGGTGSSLALRNDGSVVVWGRDLYGELTVPADATPAMAIDSKGFHTLCLKANGIVKGFGSNNLGQSDVPLTLDGVVAVAAGYVHSLALKSDGTLVGWGSNSLGQISIPIDLARILAISAGETSSAVLCDATNQAPVLMRDVVSQTASSGQNVIFSVAASGNPLPTYQWQKLASGAAAWMVLIDDGTNAGATTAALQINNVTSAMTGDQFRCVVTNSMGAVTSSAAALTTIDAPSNAVISISVQ